MDSSVHTPVCSYIGLEQIVLLKNISSLQCATVLVSGASKIVRQLKSMPFSARLSTVSSEATLHLVCVG